MKKSVLIIVAVLVVALCVPAVAFAAFAPSAFKAAPAPQAQPATHPIVQAAPADTGTCPGFHDADGDGVCDNHHGASGICPGYVDADGDGVCDNYGSGCGRGNGCGNGNAASGYGHHGQAHHGGNR